MNPDTLSGTSKDDFLDHGFTVLQFKSGGHRSGLDAILVAATVSEAERGRIADLGSGAGVVGMAIAHRCHKTSVDMFEIDGETVELSNASLQLERNSPLAHRVHCYLTDVRNSGGLLNAARQQANSYAHVVANPPFNDGNHRISPGDKRAMAHVLELGEPEVWIRTASTLCKARGRISLIIRPENLMDFLVPLKKRFGDIRVLPIHSKQRSPANRLLIGAVKGSRAALQVLSPLIVHTEQDGFTPETNEILRGRAGIDLSG